MEYRAVHNRCAVHLESLNLPVSTADTLAILRKKGFKVLEVDVVALARSRINASIYRRGAKPSEAPGVVDCSSFVKWLYGKRGIWLPRRSIQQREFGTTVPVEDIGAGDLVFLSGAINYYHTDPCDSVGHVGIATGEGTIVHAADAMTHVVETSIEGYISETTYRGARRYVPRQHVVITLETPPDREVECADDIRWIVLQSL